MKHLFTLALVGSLFLIFSLFSSGCLTRGALQEFIAEESEVDATLVNYALPENGGRVIASGENASHPASTLNNGVVASEKWDSSEGWEVSFEGPFSRGLYFEYGQDAWLSGFFGRGRGNTNQRPRPGVIETDPMWRGLRGTTFFGEVNTALAVAIVEFPEEKQVGRVVIYTVDSKKYPASEYGVSDLLLQYWAPSARSWFNVDRYHKEVGQKHDSILNNKSGKVVFRFKPVRTSKVRLAVRWTNDSERYKIGPSHYAKGTVRLTEIEVYGFEKKIYEKTQLTLSDMSNTPNDSDTDLHGLDASSEESEGQDQLKTALKEAEAEVSEEQKRKRLADDRESILQLIRLYEEGYKNRDLTSLLSTISPRYSRDGEDIGQLRQKMESLFSKYEQIDFVLSEVFVDQNGDLAMVEANYAAKMRDPKSPALDLSGKLYFNLAKENSVWKIVRIDTRRR